MFVVIIDPLKGNVVFRDVFDSNSSSDQFEKLILDGIQMENSEENDDNLLKNGTKIPRGHIVVAVSQGQFLENLSYTVKRFFSRMGSK